MLLFSRKKRRSPGQQFDNTDSKIASLIIFNQNKEIFAEFHSPILEPYDLTDTIKNNPKMLHSGKIVRNNKQDYFLAIVPIIHGKKEENVGFLAIASSFEFIDKIIFNITRTYGTYF